MEHTQIEPTDGEANLKALLNAVLSWCALFAVLFYFIPPAVELFRDFEVSIPFPGMLYVNLSNRLPFQTGGVLLLSVVLIIVMKDYVVRNPRLRLRINIAIMRVFGLTAALGLLSLLLNLLAIWFRYNS